MPSARARLWERLPIRAGDTARARRLQSRLAQLGESFGARGLQSVAASDPFRRSAARTGRVPGPLRPLRRNPWVETLDRRIERLLADTGWIRRGQSNYVGRPLPVTRNDYWLDLFNGQPGAIGSEEEAAGRAAARVLRGLSRPGTPAEERLFECAVYAEISRIHFDRRAPRHLERFDPHAVAVPAGDRERVEHGAIADCGLWIAELSARRRLVGVARGSHRVDAEGSSQAANMTVSFGRNQVSRVVAADQYRRGGWPAAPALRKIGGSELAACRARSSTDFVSKMGIVEVDTGSVPADGVAALQREANELMAITVSSIKTARVVKDRTR